MKTFMLGNTDIHLPKICLGTMTWGEQNTEAEAHEQLDYAVNERGITFLDTAEIYPIPPSPEKTGLTETYIGNWLEKRGKRDDLFVATKLSPATFMKHRPNKGRLDEKSVREAVEGSLNRLKTDYIDLYQIHWPVRTTNFFGKRGVEEITDEVATSIQEILESLQVMVREGKIKHIGVSNETPWGVNEYLRLAREKGLPRIQSIQNQYSLLNRTFEVGLSEIAMREKISLLAYSVLSMGVLSGKYLGGTFPKGSRFELSNRNVERYNPARAQAAIAAYVELAHKYNLDPAHLAYGYALTKKFVGSVIIGASSLEQLKTAVDAADIQLPEELLKDVAAIYELYPDVVA
jgi:aryl-alcohol dehydrogenase-like predicted oxidoreductase